MCGRFSKTKDERDSEIREFIDPKKIFADLKPRYNIAPSQPIPVVRIGDDGDRELVDILWGFLPSWVKDPSNSPKPINAKGETVADKPFFRSAFKKKRCLILADGFYEWKKTDEGKQPYYIRMKGGDLFCFAGLWDQCEGEQSCTIITITPNSVCREVHNRMPVIISKEDYDIWLSPETDKEKAVELIKSYPAEFMEAFPVSRHVNSPKNEDLKCIERI